MTYACVNNNTITSIVTNGDYSILSKNNDIVVDISDLLIQPEIGWTLSGNKLIPNRTLSQVEIITNNILHPAKAFANKMMDDFASENIALGITQAGKTRDVGDALKEVMFWLQSGSLYEVLTEIETIKGTLDGSLAPFVTPARLDSFKQKIQNFLSGKA